VIRGYFFAGLALLSSATGGFAQAPGQFHWQPREVLTYRVEHLTSASEVIGDTKTETRTKLNLVKRWLVVEVDAASVATLQLSLAALRLETTTPKGDALIFDSQDASKNDPHLKEQLEKYIGQPLAILRVDSLGKVTEVKESRHGPATRFESELPFSLVLPEGGLRPEQTWSRSYHVTLEPPQGTGEKFPAEQMFQCKSIADNTITIGMSTIMKTMPENALDRIPLLQLQPEGTVLFDAQTGRMLSADLRIEKQLTGHQGEGSSYRFQSSYKEELQKGN
jgi:hypothetical protein